MESIDLNPVDYAYSLDENEHLVPDVVDGDRIPSDFPLPCNCLKCAKSTVCPCRVKQLWIARTLEVILNLLHFLC